jgi:hypothetical protein
MKVLNSDLQNIPPNSCRTHIFSRSWIFPKIDHTFGYKVITNKFKKIEITFRILSEHSGIKLEINSKRNHRKYSNAWRLNNTLLNDQ